MPPKSASTDHPDTTEADRRLIIALAKEASGTKGFQPARIDRLVKWVEHTPELPAETIDWPCIICDAGAGEMCGGELIDDPNALFPTKRAGLFCHTSRGWEIGITQPGAAIGREPLTSKDHPADRCSATVEVAAVRAHRGRCLCCEWRGPVRSHENEATEDAVTHAWPKWRDLPPIPGPLEIHEPMYSIPAHKLWLDRLTGIMPKWWFDGIAEAAAKGINRFGLDGPPIRTTRSGLGTRHVPNRAFTGYDMSAGTEPEVKLPKDPKQDCGLSVEDIANFLGVEMPRKLASGKRLQSKMKTPDFDEGEEDEPEIDVADETHKPMPKPKSKQSPVTAMAEHQAPTGAIAKKLSPVTLNAPQLELSTAEVIETHAVASPPATAEKGRESSKAPADEKLGQGFLF